MADEKTCGAIIFTKVGNERELREAEEYLNKKQEK